MDITKPTPAVIPPLLLSATNYSYTSRNSRLAECKRFLRAWQSKWRFNQTKTTGPHIWLPGASELSPSMTRKVHIQTRGTKGLWVYIAVVHLCHKGETTSRISINGGRLAFRSPFARGRRSITCTYTFYAHSLADSVARSQAVHLCAIV